MSNGYRRFISKGVVGVLVGCVFIFCALILSRPPFVLGRFNSAANACPNNLRQIAAAAEEFALEHHLTNGAPINFPDDLTPYVKLNSAGKIPGCPAGGRLFHQESWRQTYMLAWHHRNTSARFALKSVRAIGRELFRHEFHELARIGEGEGHGLKVPALQAWRFVGEATVPGPSAQAITLRAFSPKISGLNAATLLHN